MVKPEGRRRRPVFKTHGTPDRPRLRSGSLRSLLAITYISRPGREKPPSASVANYRWEGRGAGLQFVAGPLSAKGGSRTRDRVCPGSANPRIASLRFEFARETPLISLRCTAPQHRPQRDSSSAHANAIPSVASS